MSELGSRVWKTPELVILMRGEPEETLLTACKTSGQAPGATLVSGCMDNSVVTQKCLPYSCDTISPS